MGDRVNLLLGLIGMLLVLGYGAQGGWAQSPTNLPGATTSSLGTPAQPTLAFVNNGGMLGNGTYCYRITALNGVGQTLPSVEKCITISNGLLTNKVGVTFSLSGGATSVNIYGRTMGQEAFIANATTSPYRDDGSITPSGPLPTSDTSGSIISLVPGQTPLTISGLSGVSADPYYNVKAFGAQGNTQSGLDGSMTFNTPTLTAASSTPFSGSTDLNKAIVVDMSVAPAPVLAGSSAGTSGSMAAGVVYYRLTFFVPSSGGPTEGTDASLEGVQATTSASGNNSVTITAPLSANGATGYFVYAVLQTGTSNPYGTSGTETRQTSTTGLSCGNGFVTGMDACKLTGPTPNATLTAVGTGGASVPSPTVLLTTISAVNSTSQVTLALNATATVSNATYSWATDDTAAINNAIAACATTPGYKVGCKVYFPPGSYWVQSPGLSVAGNTSTPQSFISLEGAAAASAKSVGGTGTTRLNGAASEIVTPDHIYALTVGSNGANSSALNSRPEIANLGFRDVSGNGNASGAIHFEQVSHAFLRSVSFIDFANGSGAFFDSHTSSGMGGISQYNFALDTTALNVQTPFLFANGQYSSNWIIGGNLAGSQVGGGACLDFQKNELSGAKTGGHNYLFYPQCNFFPTAIHLFDQNSDLISFHAENTVTSPPDVIGSGISGTGILLDGTSSTANCIDNLIAQTTLTNFSTEVAITANCAHTVITSPDYASSGTHLSDSGVNTQTIGAPPDVQNMTFAGNGSSEVQYYNPVAGNTNKNNLECFGAAALSARDCASAPAMNFIGVALNTPTSTSVPVAVQILGTATVNLDNAPTGAGAFVCASKTTAFQAHDSGTMACNPGQQVGIEVQSGTGNTALVFLQKD